MERGNTTDPPQVAPDEEKPKGQCKPGVVGWPHPGGKESPSELP